MDDRLIIRDLAKRVSEIADMPVQTQRRDLWKRHNNLETTYPLILIFPEGSWRELLPESALQCKDEPARRIEWSLRSRLYYHEHLQDDTVIEKEWIVNKVIHDTGWGLEAKRIPSPTEFGAWLFDPVINTPADMRALRYPEITYDETATHRKLAETQDLFGDILEIKLKGIARISYHLMAQYTALRGLEEVMMDMVLNPSWLHEAMAFLTEGHAYVLKQYIDQNLLSLNNDSTYHSSGGNGYIASLPAEGFNPDQIRPLDMWASAEAQELAGVSPRMHREFSLDYEKRLLEPFALNGYGCCEDLTAKMKDVLTIPNIRRISISPFADVDKCAEQLAGGKVIYSWKPNPAHLVGHFDEDRIRAYLRHAVEVTQTHGCVFEMILKDTHTCEHRPERFDRWASLAQEVRQQTAKQVADYSTYDING